MQGNLKKGGRLRPWIPLKGLLQKALKNPQNLKKILG